MPKISVYLPDDLYRRARASSLPISSIAQGAIEAALRIQANDVWLDSLRARGPLTTEPFDTTELMAAVRDEWGT